MTTRYEAVRYAADGHTGEIIPNGDSDGEVIWSGDLDDCRSAISRRVGDMDSRRWDGGDDDIEAYHDSDEEGCGGYSIRRIDTFRIENLVSGVVMGEYEAPSEYSALDAWAQDAGYQDYEHAQDVSPADVGEIRVKKV